ncbi:hypothetical protein [Kitasatospora sp. NBC_00458]|uniref:hypothetical protein n=1 Tax=Kitasatospora sp. NBC_00458 TaxID=2903568 RepID=UPI002E17F039
MGVLSALSRVWTGRAEERESDRRARRSGEPWPTVEAAGFVAEAGASGLFESVEAVEVEAGDGGRSPRLVDVHLDAAGRSFIVMLVDGGDHSRIVCDGYVFDWVPSCLAMEFLTTVVSGQAEVAFSRSGRHVRLGVPLADEGTWRESRSFRGDLEPWELDAMGRTWNRTLERSAADLRERLQRHPTEGHWTQLAYWDPLPTARALTATMGNGRWEERSRLNVPGPFYAGETDGGLNGPHRLPEHVLSGDEHHGFVHRQPVNPRELAGLVRIAEDEPAGGYAWDGDEHWTPEAVREWWAGRDAVRAWIAGELGGDRNEPAALRRYAAHLDDGLEDYLRGYLFWLIERREPRLGEELPEL